jgi:hypothetical protein
VKPLYYYVKKLDILKNLCHHFIIIIRGGIVGFALVQTSGAQCKKFVKLSLLFLQFVAFNMPKSVNKIATFIVNVVVNL